MEQKIKSYFADKPEIAAVYLFGSRAAGKDHQTSDVDIAILLFPEFLESAQSLKEKYLLGLGRYLKKDIHPVIMNHAGEFLLKQILSKGKPVLVKNSKFEKYFKMISISRIADFNFHLQKMQAGLTKKILEG
ncbi:MAG: nucleotidyltransferase domain-containing protein [Desulfobacteraceae bacterium]|nr:nucleotidyltransferase domain-containing protein [Desulfobacteraceae bacterium]